MKATADQLETQLAELSKRLGSARFWKRHFARVGPIDIHNTWAVEVKRLGVEFAAMNARLQRKKRKGNG